MTDGEALYEFLSIRRAVELQYIKANRSIASLHRLEAVDHAIGLLKSNSQRDVGPTARGPSPDESRGSAHEDGLES